MKQYVFTIEARPMRLGTPFPIDMLRYDNCRPAREVDSAAIAQSLVERDVDRILLVRYGSKNEAITEERWRSFSWTAEVVEMRSL